MAAENATVEVNEFRRGSRRVRPQLGNDIRVAALAGRNRCPGLSAFVGDGQSHLLGCLPDLRLGHAAQRKPYIVDLVPAWSRTGSSLVPVGIYRTVERSVRAIGA